MASRNKPAPANKIFLFDIRESVPEEYESRLTLEAESNDSSRCSQEAKVWRLWTPASIFL